MTKILSVVLGGGKGSRLYPLTKERAKPAVPFGGKFRLVDIPISNCINSGLRNIFVLTQFNTASLHFHISSTYRFDTFSGGFVEVLAAEQTFDNDDWYMGTADAVRKNEFHFRSQEPTHYMILSGDQLYRMDLKDFFKKHLESGADVTIAATPVTRKNADQLGILQLDNKGYINSFLEKPGPHKNIDEYRIPALRKKADTIPEHKDYLASMGIYIFNAEALNKGLDNDFADFGKEVIPMMIKEASVRAHVYKGYWEDIGTIRNFFESNLNLATPRPFFNLYDMEYPIYTHRRDLPPSKINSCHFHRALASEGSIINGESVVDSLVGVRSFIHRGATLDHVYIMGADIYETTRDKEINKAMGRPNLGIGPGTQVRKAIIDKSVRMGQDCRIGIDDNYRADFEGENYYIRDGIIIIPKQAIIPDGTVI
ncbi:glucose-1-phosphate adenylyltransferase [Oceanispirochaeta sp.]|jgi:glucose-1-phosphate adenylyltransferase|uniref:glucose-1-phosphate adenylyltransferase n=1 Tax=Oceanispirochaeta sp. TaxID=2035350 RepID=UPI00262B397A|nr:glucose-1-phosphate adenylyltransferase [Oceanispirochaeta sp.]MDA3957231.1 glucose-1-phosphate adenylyltransferase [Oceanispirochaeta sp.]